MANLSEPSKPSKLSVTSVVPGVRVETALLEGRRVPDDRHGARGQDQGHVRLGFDSKLLQQNLNIRCKNLYQES